MARRTTGPFLLALLPTLLLAVQNAAGALPAQESRYRLEPFSGSVRTLRERFTPRELDLVKKLNRRDLRHLAELDALVVPLRPSGEARAHSPLPLEYSWARCHPKALVVHKPSQTFGAYEHGRLVRWGPVSTGRERHRTPSGLFHLNWRSRGRHSTVNPNWYMPWYFNFENDSGLAFHAYSMTGGPASHGCIRMLEEDARWLYRWGEEWKLDKRGWTVVDPGTPVLSTGRYDFDAPPPWRSQHWLVQGADLPAAPELAPKRACPAADPAPGPLGDTPPGQARAS
jgi:hypothetical protein